MFGLEIFDDSSIKTLSMADFTIRKIFEADVAAASSNWTKGTRSDYLTLTVPGYVASECFVVITPKSYSGSQSESSNALLTPYYRDIGGEQIGIVRYMQDNWYDAANQIFRDRWRLWSVACTVEVFKVIGN